MESGIIRTSLCLASLYDIAVGTIPTETFPDLWPRVWPAISFVDRQPYSDPGRHLADLKIITFFLLGHLQDESQTRALIYSTPGVLVVAAKIWTMLLQPGNRLLANNAFMDLCKFIVRLGLCAARLTGTAVTRTAVSGSGTGPPVRQEVNVEVLTDGSRPSHP
ncbi:hypothetical protein B0H17DRAFT_1208993 [Mycena rosella]|uniref:Uncharacterized protein n=1 Tax=Mycena rosella TaxID=1033263 RepID=A0AAD7CZQ7_MYCRO|nr:hypothetical protein B0H17DRAFT_1208993 [Mycena rosella]